MTTATSVAHGKPDAGKLARPVWGEERGDLPLQGGVAPRSYSTRLSRSLLDFARLMQSFEEHGVAFVSVTQQFNSATSMGRLVLNVLLSFAQFEREIIAERTRDKIAATRRKGKWSGGTPLLGYDLDPRGGRLVVNQGEAARVRAIFDLYLEHRALRPVVQELARRGWATKRWQTRKGRPSGGRPFTKTNLHRLLSNVAYAGRVRYKDEVHAGEQPALIDPDTFNRVQALLRSRGHTAGPGARGGVVALLKGLLHCAPCGCAMTPAHTTRNGSRRYRYYVCTGAQKRGWQTCPSKSVPAAPIEELIVGQIRALAHDPAALQEVLTQVRQEDDARPADAAAAQVVAGSEEVVDPLTPAEQARLVRLLVARVDYDGTRRKVAISFHASALQALAADVATGNHEEQKV
jgi:site-specific DNA recombinase